MPDAPWISSSADLDPVCGMVVDPAHPKGGSLVHAGRSYHFCSAHCREAFAADPESHLSSPAHEPETAPPGAVYLCPMDPEVSADRPGPCPVCGMALEARFPGPGEADEARDAARRRLFLCLGFGLPLLALAESGRLSLALASWAGPRTPAFVEMGLAFLLAAWPGAPVFAKAFRSLRTRALNMYTLIGLGTGAALAYSAAAALAPGLFPPAFWTGGPGPDARLPLYFEAAGLILTLAQLGEWLELKARGRAGDALRALLDLSPKTARLLGPDGSESDVPLGSVVPGDRLRVRPGEAVPVDGRVLEGSTWVDESRVTGESAPVSKAPGGAVTGGTLNGSGALVMEAERVGADGLLGRIAAQVAEAQRSRASVQRLADRFAAWFVPGVAALAALTFCAWALWGPQPRLAYALLNALAVLLVACPCALGLAAPMSVLVGAGVAARRGVLFRDAAALENLAQVDTVVLDKTGTLTEGKPRLTGIVAPAPGGEDGLLALAAAVEVHSEHPLARAVVEAARERGLALDACSGFEAVRGQGVSGEVRGLAVRVGKAAFCGGASESLESSAAELRSRGAGVFFVGRDGRTAGLLSVSDPLRAGAADAVRALQGLGLDVRMLSGDADIAARVVAEWLCLDAVQGDQSPLDKAEALRALRAGGRRVAFVGDGVNDAPALAVADVGLALGSGTDAARLSAPVTLLRGDVGALLAAIAVSKAVRRNIRQNLGWAAGYNLLGLPLAAGVLYPLTGWLLSPVFAAAAMSFSSVMVIANALRLRNLK